MFKPVKYNTMADLDMTPIMGCSNTTVDGKEVFAFVGDRPIYASYEWDDVTEEYYSAPITGISKQLKLVGLDKWICIDLPELAYHVYAEDGRYYATRTTLGVERTIGPCKVFEALEYLLLADLIEYQA